MRIFRALAVVAVLFVVGGAIAKAGGGSAERAQNTPSRNATEANTPRVGPHGSVEVDDLRWRLADCGGGSVCVSAEPFLGEGPTTVLPGGGIFVTADLMLTSHRSESATLTDEVVDLVAAGKTYKPDAEAEMRLPASEHTLTALEVDPGLPAGVTVVFDVPRHVISEHPELRFNELGFGETHGYIALPARIPIEG